MVKERIDKGSGPFQKICKNVSLELKKQVDVKITIEDVYDSFRNKNNLIVTILGYNLEKLQTQQEYILSLLYFSIILSRKCIGVDKDINNKEVPSQIKYIHEHFSKIKKANSDRKNIVSLIAIFEIIKECNYLECFTIKKKDLIKLQDKLKDKAYYKILKGTVENEFKQLIINIANNYDLEEAVEIIENMEDIIRHKVRGLIKEFRFYKFPNNHKK